MSSKSRCIITNSTKMSSGTSLIASTSYDQKAFACLSRLIRYRFILFSCIVTYFFVGKIKKKSRKFQILGEKSSLFFMAAFKNRAGGRHFCQPPYITPYTRLLPSWSFSTFSYSPKDWKAEFDGKNRENGCLKKLKKEEILQNLAVFQRKNLSL